ncbi:MAG: UxaA family hydrolase [Proteobacteria bacterium]|nr:UxaA family hydrolase [Pseudomonadota bacterium]
MENRMKNAFQIHLKDNVATVNSDVNKSEEVGILTPQGGVVSTVKPTENILSGHKLAIVPCEKGEKIVKYGETIGIATDAISQGEWVHTHNVESDRMAIGTKEVLK